MLRASFHLTLCTAIGILALLGRPEVAPAQGTQHIVQVTDNSFIPSTLAIVEGDQVLFRWEATMEHNVHAGNGPGEPTAPYERAFVSPLRISSYSMLVNFDRDFLTRNPSPTGLYNYYCEPHFFMGMRGSIQVTRRAHALHAPLSGVQVVPPNGTGATGNCSVALNSSETHVDINCSNNLGGSVSGGFYRGGVGQNGNLHCAVNSSGATRCTVDREVSDALVSGSMYLQLSNSSSTIRGQIVAEGGDWRVSGTVVKSTGGNLANVTVRLGQRFAVTDSRGNYAFDHVANGYYSLSALRDGYQVIPGPGTHPALVNDGDLSRRNFTAQLDLENCETDTDGDGVCDEQELVDGSDPGDRGSSLDQLESPINILWNGFIDIRNIAEIVNKGSTAGVITFSLFNINGERVNQLSFNLGAGAQSDIIINDLTGFQRDSYGLAKIEFGPELVGAIDGRVSYYRDSSDRRGFEFAFSVPFLDALKGSSYVGFNTFQPSLNQAHGNFVVAQWLSLVNLDASATRRFNINRYNMSGVRLTSGEVTIPPLGRVDLEGGHVNPGPSQVGLHEINPVDPSAPYLAQLYRYGGNAPTGQNPSSYYFAFPLLAKPGNGLEQRAPIATGGGAQNWFELVNTEGTPSTVNVLFYNAYGAAVGNNDLVLPPRAQRHLNAGALLPAGTSGSVKVTPISGAVIGQSMFYFRNPADGGISAMYGSSLREPIKRELTGSYNLFINMENWLKITNLRSTPTNIQLTVYNSSGQSRAQTVQLLGFAGRDLALHDTGAYGTRLNDYGLIRLETTEPKAISAEILRLRPDTQSGSVDFAAPTLMR